MYAAILMVTYGALYETIGEFPSLTSRTIFHTMFMTFTYTIIIGIYYLIKGFIKLLLKNSKNHFVFRITNVNGNYYSRYITRKEPMNRLNFNEQIVEENEVLHKNIKH